MSAHANREIIASAAVRFSDGRIFTGTVHFDARDEAADFYRSKNAPMPAETDEGFITTRRRFLDRHGAAVLMGLENYILSGLLAGD